MFRFHGPAGERPRRLFRAALVRLPEIEGRPIRIRFLPDLRVRRGRLLSTQEAGTAVHAGTFLRKREIVLDSQLLCHPRELARILVHEVFHFVWLRLGNDGRRDFEALVEEEMRRGARGELGWSAEWRKRELSREDRCGRTRRWREYVCESFCDSAAWYYCGLRRHGEVTLAPAFQRQRRQWFRIADTAKPLPV